VRSVRNECLTKVIPLGEQHLRELLREYLAHYHLESPHQGLDNSLIEPSNDNSIDDGRVLRRARIGGVLSFHYRAAA
jgi:putative transposase